MDHEHTARAKARACNAMPTVIVALTRAHDNRGVRRIQELHEALQQAMEVGAAIMSALEIELATAPRDTAHAETVRRLRENAANVSYLTRTVKD